MSLRRQFRKILAHPWLAFLQGFTVLFGAVVAVGQLPVAGFESLWSQPGGYVFGRRVAAGEVAGPRGIVRGFAGVVFVLTLFLTVLKETTEGAMDSHVDTMLLAAGPRSVAVGGLLWNVLLMGLQFGVVVVAGAVAFGAGSGSPAATALFVLAGAAMVATAVPAGFVIALLVRTAFRRVGVLREHRLVAGAPLVVGYFLLFARIRESIELLAATPVGWYADVGLLGLGGDPVAAAAVLAASPVVAVAFGALSVPLAERVWYADPPAPEDDGGASATVLAGDGAALSVVAGRPARAVARTVWLRVRREPRALVFAAFPLALVASSGVEVVARRPAALPVVVAVYGAATVGMGPTLNPLGAAGVGLQAALTAQGGGRHLVHGYALAAVLPGAPLVAVAALVAGIATGGPPLTLLTVALLGAALSVAAALVSLGVGVAMPNLEGLRPSGSGIRPPKLWATTAFLLAMAVVGLPATVGVGWAGAVDAAGGPPATTVAAGGIGLTLVLAALASGMAYRQAMAAIAGYEME
ncbi:hypothetical protein BRD00_06810 [Halobacteriales archaeon QS_8_69_26]|nr:MAG: hypothetical protein BRD00_06810 [Halobacteriales archaeon QS_8_69_26]